MLEKEWIMKSKSAWKEFLESIQFCFDSKKGKYSLESYLEIIGQYTDQLILQTEDSGLIYTAGECIVSRSTQEESYDFGVMMYFIDEQGNAIKKEAFRKIPITKFTREAVEQIGTKKLKFNIEKPEGRVIK